MTQALQFLPSVVDPDPYWIRIQELPGSGSNVFGSTTLVLPVQVLVMEKPGSGSVFRL